MADNRKIKIKVEDLTLIFGKRKQEALTLLDKGVSKEEILKKTKCTVGVNKVNFEIKQGEIFVIMGLSGSGKSTLIRCLNRLNEPTAGKVIFDDHDITRETNKELLETRRTEMSMVFQKFGLLPHRTIIENAAFGFSVSPLFIALIISQFNWSIAYQILAFLTLLFVLFAFVFYRDNPEECGLIPDGKIIAPKQKSNPTFQTKRQYTLKEARSTWVFWVFALGLSFNAFFITGFTFNVISIFESCGYSEQKALSVFVPASIISIVTAITGNILSDYIRMQKLLIVFLIGCLLASLGVAILEYPIGFYVLILGNGVMGGLFSVIAAITWPRFYGREHLGAISGLALSLIVFSSAIAPLFFSRIFTLTNSYSLAGYIGIVAVVLLLILSVKAKNPQLQ